MNAVHTLISTMKTREEDPSEWDMHFAWIPMRTNAGNWVWLTYFMSKKVFEKIDA